jgi:hypothetical protein
MNREERPPKTEGALFLHRRGILSFLLDEIPNVKRDRTSCCAGEYLNGLMRKRRGKGTEATRGKERPYAGIAGGISLNIDSHDFLN